MTKLPAPRIRVSATKTGETWRWIPTAAEREAGSVSVKLDADRPTWSTREAARLTRQAQKNLAQHAKHARRRTVSMALQHYLKSTSFTKLRPATKKNYQVWFGQVVDRWGSTKIDTIRPHQVRQWYEDSEHEQSTNVAKKRVAHLSIVMAYTRLSLGWIESNPCERLQLKTPPPRQRRLTWDEFFHLIDTAVATNHHMVAAAMHLCMWCGGQRATDLMEARPEDFKIAMINGEERLCWDLTRSKSMGENTRDRQNLLAVNKSGVYHIQQILDATPKGATLLRRPGGEPFVDEDLSHRFAKVRNHAARTMPSVKDVQFRDLRRTFSAFSRDAGTSDQDRADALGNSMAENPQLRSVYNPSSDDRAATAIDAVVPPKSER